MILSALALMTSAVVLAQEKTAPVVPPATTATATASPAPAGDDPVIITAGAVKIHKSDFEAAVKTLPAEYQSFALGPGKKQFAEDFLRMKLLASEGMKNGLDKDPEVIKQLNLVKENLVATEQLKKIDSSISVSDADLRKAYDDNKKDYEEVTARHILIAFKGSPAMQKGKKPLTDAEAKAKAEALRAEIVSGKAKFADVAKKESDDIESGKNGGELGSFGRGQMVPEFEQAAFAAKDGEITPVVRTQYGYHIIQVEKHSFKSFDEVKPMLEKNLKQQKLRQALDALKDASNPVFDEVYFATPKPTTTTVPPTPAPKPEEKK